MLYYQSPLPPKVYHGPEEPDVDGYSDHDKNINRALARMLFDRHLATLGVEPRTLDIGAKIPFLADCFAKLGCDAWALDPMAAKEVPGYDVHMIDLDFEEAQVEGKGVFHLITLIHVFEHFNDPLNALRTLRRLLTPNGRVFIRMPDSGVKGFERDFTPHHYAIHPYIHSLDTLTEMLLKLGDVFCIATWEAMPGFGQCDYTLKPV